MCYFNLPFFYLTALIQGQKTWLVLIKKRNLWLKIIRPTGPFTAIDSFQPNLIK